jgi:hypothetical protein
MKSRGMRVAVVSSLWRGKLSCEGGGGGMEGRRCGGGKASVVRAIETA